MMGLKRRIESLEDQLRGKGESLEDACFQAAKRAVIEEMTDQELELMEAALKAQQRGEPLNAEQFGIMQAFRGRMAVKLK